MITSDTYRQIPKLSYRESDHGAHLTFNGDTEFREEHLTVDAELSRREIVTLASALLAGSHFRSREHQLKLHSEDVPGYNEPVLQIANEETEISISAEVAQVWGRMLWLINALPEEQLEQDAEIQVKSRNNQILLEAGELKWECSPLHALILSEGLEQKEHEEILLQGTEGALLCSGDFVGIHLISSSAHIWIAPGQIRKLRSALLMMAGKKGGIRRDSSTQPSEVKETDTARKPQVLQRR